MITQRNTWNKTEASPVSVVEEHFFHEWEDSQLKQHPVEGGQLHAKATVAILHEPVEHKAEGDANNSLVEDHHQDGMLQFSRIHLR